METVPMSTMQQELALLRIREALAELDEGAVCAAQEVYRALGIRQARTSLENVVDTLNALRHMPMPPTSVDKAWERFEAAIEKDGGQ